MAQDKNPSACNYVILEGSMRSDFCVLGFIENFADDYKLMKGYSLAKEWPEDVCFSMDPDFKKRIKLSDHLVNQSNVLVASPSLQTFLREEAIPNLEFLRVKIINHKKKIASSDYCVVNLVTTQDCIDKKRSGITWNKINPDDITSFQQLVVDENKIARDAALFRAKHLKTAIFVRRALAEKMQKARFTGILLTEISEYRS